MHVSHDTLIHGRFCSYYYEGSVHLSMPRHDYVKSGRLAVTDKTKPINIYIYIYIYTSYSIIFSKNQRKKIV